MRGGYDLSELEGKGNIEGEGREVERGLQLGGLVYILILLKHMSDHIINEITAAYWKKWTQVVLARRWFIESFWIKVQKRAWNASLGPMGLNIQWQNYGTSNFLERISKPI